MIGQDLEVLVKGVVKQIAAEYSGFELDKEDLVSEGYLIAVEQMPNYKANKGATISTFLYQQVSYRLRNYVSREAMKLSHGDDKMQRVSMEHVDIEMSLKEDLENKILLDDFRLSLETQLEKDVFDWIRAGYTYREICKSLNLSLGSVSNIVKRWRSYEV